MTFTMKPGDKYYDGLIVDSGRTIEEIDRDFEEEAKRLEGQAWPSEYQGD